MIESDSRGNKTFPKSKATKKSKQVHNHPIAKKSANQPAQTKKGMVHNHPAIEKPQFFTYETKPIIKATPAENPNIQNKSDGSIGSKSSKKVHKIGSLSSGGLEPKQPKLSPAEKEILLSITTEYKTPKQIAEKRNTSESIIYRFIRKLKQKGYLNPVSKMVHKNDGTCEPPTPPGTQPGAHLVRLHSQQWKIDLLHRDDRYARHVGKSILIEGNHVTCHRDCIEVYSREGLSFYGKDPQEATEKAWAYWLNQFAILENDLKLMLVKPRAQNIHQVKAHYAEINNEIAQESELKGIKMQIRAPEDGKVWFICDNSYDMAEAEFIHSKTGEQDASKVLKHINDWRENPEVPKQSELSTDLQALIKLTHENAAGLNAVYQVLKEVLPKVSEMKPPHEPQPPQQDDKHKPEYPVMGYA